MRRVTCDTGVPPVRVRSYGRDARAALKEVVPSLRGTDLLFVADDLYPVFAKAAVGGSSSSNTLVGPIKQRIRQPLVNSKIFAFQKLNLRVSSREVSYRRVNPLNQYPGKQEKRRNDDSGKTESDR